VGRTAFAVGAAASFVVAGACTRPGGGTGGRTTTTAMPADHGMDHSIPDRLNHAPTPEQIQAAIKLVDDTKAATVNLRTKQQAAAAGYNDIGDRMHFTNGTYREDGRELDPNRIESLVYNPTSGQLMAAMYNMEPGTTMANVQDIAGNWTIFHNHDYLCWQSTVKGTPGYTRLGGVVVNGKCTGTSVKHEAVLMIHVWVIPNSCGPFATIPGEGAGSCLPNFPNP
jgi:hypothetical protein